MAELTPQERLQPSLLDRLTDDEPDKQQESRERRVLTTKELRESVRRDLEWLLNSSNLSAREGAEEYTFVPGSVLNYGLPALAGNTAQNIDVVELERILRQVIWDFEPRLLHNTLKVHAVLSEELMSHNTLIFEIEGELWSQPMPEPLFLRTEVDLEGGKVKVEEYTGVGSR